MAEVKIKKCLKRYETLPEYYWDNVEAIKALLDFKNNQVPFREEFANLAKVASGNFISSLGHYILDKEAQALYLLGDISLKDIKNIQQNMSEIEVYFYKDGEMQKLNRFEKIYKDDVFQSVKPDIWKCGRCPAQASCLLAKTTGKISFEEDNCSDVINLANYSWSGEQQIFLDESLKNQFLMINAAAGTGKTTVINEALHQEGGVLDRFKEEDIILISFTNTAAKEMKERIASYAKTTGKSVENIRISTWHSLALDIIKEDYEKLGYKEEPKLLLEPQGYIREYLVKMGKPISKEEIDKLLENPHGDIELPERALFRNACKKDNIILLDEAFNILFKAIAVGILAPKCLIVDEFQDSSYKELRILEIMSKRLDALFVLGDIRQAIYAFRGGVNNTFLQCKNAIENSTGKKVKELAFSESFRLPKMVAAKSNEMLVGTGLPDIKSATDKEGVVINYDSSQLSTILEQVDGKKGIIARNNAPLIKLYISSLKNREDVYFKHGNNLGNYPIHKIITNAVHLKLNNSPRLDSYLRAHGLYFNNIETFKAMLKNYDILTRYMLMKVSELSTFEEILEELLVIGYDPIKIIKENINIYLLTAHSSKGMEFDNVIITSVDDYRVYELVKQYIDLNIREEEEYNSFLERDENYIPFDEKENRKVAFVALSRAKSNLFIENT